MWCKQIVNNYHAAAECRRQVKNGKKKIGKKRVKIVEFHDHIWNHHKKYIQISTNIPGIGSVNRETDVNKSDMSQSKHDVVGPMPAFYVLE